MTDIIEIEATAEDAMTGEKEDTDIDLKATTIGADRERYSNVQE